MNNPQEQLMRIIKGEIVQDEEAKKKYSRDTSIFEITPRLIIFPKDSHDIQELVKFISQKDNKKEQTHLSLTARSAGTDMTGGPLTDSIVLDVTKYLNTIKEIGNDYAVVEPGLYFRDFEKEIAKKNLFYPPYPASKELCALGGIVANDSGGEKTLRYGKTHDYVLGLKVVLSDGKEHYFEKLNRQGLQQKLTLGDFEGDVYRKMYKLCSQNEIVLKNAKPQVSKNSSGYNLWDIYDGEHFDLTKLLTGSQGTLGIITEMKLKLLLREKYEKLYVVFIKDLKHLPHFVKDVLALSPSSFEVTDDHTFRIYLRYAREMAELVGAHGLFATIKLFLPEALLILKSGMPKLVALVEFEEDEQKTVREEVKTLSEIVKKYNMIGRLCKTQLEKDKYWRLRRDTFKLLREKIKDRHAAPYVDDIIVKPEYFPQFLPKLTEILDKHKIIYTISGHLGDGNLHIISLTNLASEKERKQIWEVTDEVYALVLKYKGSLSAEHNDGLMRSPYLETQFGSKVYDLFKQVKHIFDPQNIFNPHKKVGVTREFAMQHVRKD